MRGEWVFGGGLRAHLERRDRDPTSAEEAALGEGGGLVQPGHRDPGVDEAAERGRAKSAEDMVRQQTAPMFVEQRAIGKTRPGSVGPAPKKRSSSAHPMPFPHAPSAPSS